MYILPCLYSTVNSVSDEYINLPAYGIRQVYIVSFRSEVGQLSHLDFGQRRIWVFKSFRTRDRSNVRTRLIKRKVGA